jgi:hypothetical protein
VILGRGIYVAALGLLALTFAGAEALLAIVRATAAHQAHVAAAFHALPPFLPVIGRFHWPGRAT